METDQNAPGKVDSVDSGRQQGPEGRTGANRNAAFKTDDWDEWDDWELKFTRPTQMWLNQQGHSGGSGG